MEFTQVVQNRYSCKKFDGRPVKKNAAGSDFRSWKAGADSEESAGTENLRHPVPNPTGKAGSGHAMPV